MKTYKIHLLRHGITEGNQRGQFIGKTDLPVAQQGIRDLREMKERYEYPFAELFFSSPLLRCRQTLEILYEKKAPRLVEGLRECDMGEFEGKTGEELKGDERFAAWVAGKQEGPPGGETNQTFANRCVTAFHETVKMLLSSGKREAVICAHGGVIMTILAACGLPERPFSEWMCGNGQGYTLRVTPGVWMRGGKVEVIGTLPEGMTPSFRFGDEELKA